MESPLPELILSRPFIKSFTALLKQVFRQFAREEGGYLIGRANGTVLEVIAFHHDQIADRTIGDIRLSSKSFDQAQALAGENNATIIGTWHLHPPGYGARPSATDVESLFIDRMVLNATDPDRFVGPWVHVIVPGVEVEGLLAYVLDLDADFGVTRKSTAVITHQILRVPQGRSFGLVISQRISKIENAPAASPAPAVRDYQLRPMSPRRFRAANRAGRLAGIWRLAQAGSSYARWEQVFLENFTRKLRTDIPKEHHDFVYWRIMPGSIEEFRFVPPLAVTNERFVSINVRFPERMEAIVLENPDTNESFQVEMLASDKVLDLLHVIQSTAALKSAPIVWTLLNPAAAQRFSNKVRVDDFGKVYLPEDALVGDILPHRITADLPIYWETSELSPDLVRKLRTFRFASMGYDLERLHNSHVVIAGLGLLGCGIAQLLATLSVGRLTLLDSGFVDWTDVYRQGLYSPKNVGQPKVEAAAERLMAMGAKCEPIRLEIPSVLMLDVANGVLAIDRLTELLGSANLAIGALDSFSSRAVIQIIARRRRIPFLAASLDYLPSVHVTQGSVSLFGADVGQCYGCGSGLKLQKDRGACTNAPLEFPGIVNSLAAKFAATALQVSERVTPTVCRIYGDYRIEINHLGPPAENCEVCGLIKKTKDEQDPSWREAIVRWLIS